MTSQLSILGPLQIRRASDAVDPGPRQRRLLAALVVADGDVVRSDRLFEIVWGDDGSAVDTSGALKTTVARLRRSLGGDSTTITFRANGYALDTTTLTIDAKQFEADCDEAGRLLRTGEGHDSLKLLDRALDRWGGDALGEFAEEDWARPMAVRLSERRLEARQLRVHALIAAGQAQRAAGEAAELVEEEPLREGPADALLRALQADGRTADAMRVVPALRERMVAVGLEPSPALLELEREVAAGTLAQAPVRKLRDYELLERIGAGSHATVYRAVQSGIDREVAVKMIRPELADQRGFIRQFEVEARLAARVEHPHVVPLYDFWREPGAAYLVMQLMRGGSLADLVGRSGPLAAERVAEHVAQVGGALSRAHQIGVVHRDVRPANILLDDDGRAFLADFGIAQLTTTSRAEGLTEPLAFRSPAYTAPEVLAGAPAATPADVLAFGVTVYEMLSGVAPFADSPDYNALIRRQVNEPLPLLSESRPELGPEVDKAIQRATAKKPSDRFSNVGSFVEAITTALDSVNGSPSPVNLHPFDAENPYRGLRRFDEADAGRFFGRDESIAEIVELIGRSRFVNVVGPSGSGKSSVVRAGVLPELRRGAVDGSADWFITSMVPGALPFESLEAALLRVAVNPPSSLAQMLDEDGGIARAVRRILPDDEGVVLLVIDQFEELFTLADERLRARFIAGLAACIESSDRLRVVTTIRADQLDGPLGIRSMADRLAEATAMIRPMSPRGLEQAIVQPASAIGVSVEPALVAELVSATADRPSALPLLQFALSELFERRQSSTMTLQSYEDLGGLEQALDAQAEHLVEDPATRQVARRIFARLVAVDFGDEATRRRALRSEFSGDPEAEACIERFGQARLLAFDHDQSSGVPTVEVTHEALLRGWERLARWVEVDRIDLSLLRRVGNASDAYDLSGRDDGELGRGLFLGQAKDLQERRPDLLNTAEVDWIEQSEAHEQADVIAKERAAQQQVESNRRLRRLLALAAGLLVVAVAASTIAIWLRGQANDRASEAQAATEDAQLGRLVAESAAQLESAPDLAALLALEAYRQNDTAETRGALLRAVSHNPALLGITPPPMVGTAEVLFNRDGSSALAWVPSIDDGSLQRFDPESGELLGDAIPLVEPLSGFALSGDGSTIATSTIEGRLRLFDGQGERVVEVDPPVFDVTLNESGSLALVITQSAALLLDSKTGEVQWQLDINPAAEAFIDRPAISADGRLAALLLIDVKSDNQEDRSIVFVNGDGDVLRRSNLHPDALHVAMDPTGTHIVTAGLRGDVVLHDPNSDDLMARAVTSANLTTAVAIGPDGHVVLASADNRVFSFEPGLESPSTIALSDTATAVAFNADGQLLAGTNAGSVWRLDPRRTAFEQQRTLVRFANVPRSGGLYNTPTDDFRGSEYRRLGDGEIAETVAMPEEFGTVGRFPESSTDGRWFFAFNEDWSLVAFVELGGQQQHLVNTAELAISLGRPAGEETDFRFRLGDNGRAFVIAGVDGDAVAAWFDPATGAIEAGPTQVGQVGFPLILPDESVVVGWFGIEPLLLTPGLETDPVTLVEEAGLFPIDVDPLGRILFSRSGGGVALVGPEPGQVVELAGVEGRPSDGRITANGRLAAVRLPNSIALFDLESLALIGRPMPMDAANQSTPGMSFEDDDSLLYLNSAGGVSAVAVSPDLWAEQACALANRTMTEVEWQAFVSEDGPVIDACAQF